MSLESNPFVFARALTPQESMRRQEAAALIKRATGGHNVVLHAPRRFGKTTLLKQVLESVDAEDAIPGVLVDLSDVLTVADVAARLEQTFRGLPTAVRHLIVKDLGGISITTPVGGVSLSRRSAASDPVAAVHALLELPAQIASRHLAGRVVVVFDEFQSLVNLEGLDGVFRSHIQHHTNVSYVFAGSEPSLLRVLFEDRARPLFGQAERIRLGRMDFHDAYDYFAGRFSATGKDSADVAVELVAIAEGHPQRAMLIAHLLWERVPDGGTATMSHLQAASDAALRMVDAELRYLWDSLNANDRRVIAAVASGLSPFSQDGRTLTGLPAGGAGTRAVETLERRAILERLDEDGGAALRIVDPLLTRWARRTGGARAEVYVIPHQDGFAVTDGPSLAFTRSTHPTLAEAEAEADLIGRRGRGADVMVFDTTDPNDLPDWAVGAGEE